MINKPKRSAKPGEDQSLVDDGVASQVYDFDSLGRLSQFDEDPRCGYHVMGRVAEIMAECLQATRCQMYSLARP